ncbi:hypothetical protein CSKR_103805 [Clonorchis sinensis]|uniref:Uncharacterized protein n=2 Tax=Clonorchis sinensis TaxID=79923 RepID=G7YDS9_CLOSI|nr:hypothetical protein CSKR_103805 [Clonorchis sinensis]GAA51113.1 hypothetical protein CLF_105602 [Clonorchis sinensis]
MNPYSFKRFLQNPERRRHPVQLVRSDANSIIVQGDLPDCVQNQHIALSSPAPDIDPSHVQLAETTSTTRLAFSSAIHRSPQEIFGTSAFTQTSYPSAVIAPQGGVTSPSTAPLPDIHPSNFVEDLPPLVRCTSHSAWTTHTLDILSGGLPDFISDERQENREQLFSEGGSSRYQFPVISPNTPFFDSSSHSSSLPLLPVEEASTVGSGNQFLCRSHEQLLEPPSSSPSQPRISPPACNEPAATLNRVTNVPDASDGFSVLPQPEAPVVGPEQHQYIINSVTSRQSELEKELDQTRRLLIERDRELITVRAQTEVLLREAELRIKSLEHDLAKEKLRSARGHWAFVQLRNHFSVNGEVVPTNPWLPVTTDSFAEVDEAVPVPDSFSMMLSGCCATDPGRPRSPTEIPRAADRPEHGGIAAGDVLVNGSTRTDDSTTVD